MEEAWSLACPTWWAKLQRGETPIPRLPLDEGAAERGVDIYGRLRVPDAPGQPTLAEVGGPWMEDIVRAVTGSVDRDTGRRAIGELFLLVPKKNAKTTSSAAIALTLLLINGLPGGRPNADMLIVGPTQAIADRAFDQASGMIAADEWLEQRFHVQAHKKTITDRTNGAKLRVKSFDNRVMTGVNPVVAIVDELHVLGGVPYAHQVLAQIRGGLAAFPESLLIQITTQSDSPPQGVFKSELEHARAVRDGRVPDRGLLAVTYEMPREVQADGGWRDERLWPAVLPNLGRSWTLQANRDLHAKAMERGAADEAVFASQHLNVELGIGLHGARWRAADFWEAAATGPRTLSDLLAVSEVATIGIDGGGLDDLMALAVIGREARTRRWLHWGRCWCHPEALDRRPEIAARLRDFEAAGELVVCAERGQDLEEIAALVESVHAARLLAERDGVGVDRAGIAQLVDAIQAGGRLTDERDIVGVQQGGWLTPAIHGIERRLADGTFVHAGQALQAWAVGNVKIEQTGNAVKATKAAAGRGKIDPVIALLNAAMLMATNPAPRRESYLAESELVIL